MRKLLIPAAMAFALAIGAMALTGGSAEQTSADTVLDSEELAFTTALNNYRTQNGLPPLLIDPDIQEAAEWMSADMGANNYFSHTDSLGQSPWTRMCNFGYCYSTWKGENVAAGYTSGAQVFQGWKNSPGHNSNMLGANFRVMGISRIYTAGTSYGWYWTNDFGGYVPAGAVPPGGPTNTPTPAPATASPSPTPTASPSPRPTASPSPAPTVTASPSPAPTPNPGGCLSGDSDCDGFVDSRESFNGTNRFQKCSATTARNDEAIDAWPPDTNDDRRVNMLDVLPYITHMNTQAGEQGYTARLDINGDLRVNSLDLLVIRDVLNRACTS